MKDHVVTKTENGVEVRIVVSGDKNPFEICSAIEKRIGHVASSDNRIFDMIMAERRRAAGEPDPVEPYVPLDLSPLPEKRDLLATSTVPPRTVGVRNTSVEAYRKLKSSGEQTEQQKIITAYLGRVIGGRTRSEIARDTGLKINAVCGRVNELLNDFETPLLKEVGRKKCSVTSENVNALALAV